MYMLSHAKLVCLSNFGIQCMEVRPLTLGAAGGSFSAIAWKLLAAFASQPPLECPNCDCDCPAFPSIPTINLGSFTVDIPSLCIGLVLGFLLGPLLELFVLLRAAWRSWIRTKLRDLSLPGGELYRLA